MSLNTSTTWTRIKREHGLYRYNPSGQYFARVRYRGKLIRRKLETDDLALAKSKLLDFKRDLRRTDATLGNTSFGKVLDDYAQTLQGAEATLANKRSVISRLKAKDSWFGLNSLPLRTVKPSQVSAWLTKNYGHWGAEYYNLALSVIRSAFDQAVADRIIIESPAKGLKYRPRKRPIRLTPTFEQFQAILADIRGQRFNADREESGDFVEFLGLAGLGQAEVAAIKRSDIDLDAEQMIVFRVKTSQGFAVPIFPQLRPLIEKLCKGKKHNERLFSISQARKALAASCKRLDFPSFTHRSLRRLHIVRCIEKGVDIKVIAEWQGHRDGGKLILATYSHVRAIHSQRMATLMTTDEQPTNVVSIETAASVIGV